MLVNLKSIRKASGLTRKKVAEDLGVALGTYRNWEQCVNEPRLAVDALRVADYFGVTAEYLMGGDYARAVTSRSHKVLTETAPLYGSIAAGDPLEMIEVKDKVSIPEEVLNKHPEGFFLMVNGESMNKVLPNGAYAFVDPNMEPENGDIAVVNVNGDEATLKRIYKTDNSVILSPSSMDESFKDRVYDSSDPATPEIRVLGKVVWYMVPFGFEL